MDIVTDRETLKPGWTKVKFGEVVRLCKDRSSDPAADGIERYVGLEHLEPEDLRIRRWGLVADGTTFTSRFKPGQVLFGKRRAYQRKVAVADFEGVCSGDIYVFESADQNHLLPELLPFLCQTDRFFEYAVGTSAGSLSPRTNWKSLKDFEFALPSLDEQRKIADALLSLEENNVSLADLKMHTQKLILSLRETLIGKHLRSESAVNNCFDDWKTEPLKKVADITMGFAFKSADFCDEGIQLLRMGNVRDGELDLNNKPVFLPYEYAEEYKDFLVSPGDIVISMTGTTGKTDYGYAALIDKTQPKLLLNQRVSKISSKEEINPGFLSQVMRTQGFLEQVYRSASGSKQANLSIKQLERIGVPYPCIDQQQLILDEIAKVEQALRFEDSQIYQSLTLKKLFIERSLYSQEK
jgi:type I restriction enzyme S subunit